VGDIVEVTEGDLTNLQGKVVSIKGDTVEMAGDNIQHHTLLAATRRACVASHVTRP
jgi:hypothetical protein